jgi:hypothetical protein
MPKLINHHAMKAYGSGGIAPPFLTSALDGGEWLASRPCPFTPQYILDRRLGGPESRSGRYGEEKNLLFVPGIEIQFLGHQACSSSLYRHSYPCSRIDTIH